MFAEKTFTLHTFLNRKDVTTLDKFQRALAWKVIWYRVLTAHWPETRKQLPPVAVAVGLPELNAETLGKEGTPRMDEP